MSSPKWLWTSLKCYRQSWYMNGATHMHWLNIWVLDCSLAHQNRTIAIASDFRVDGAKSPEIPQQEGVLGSEIAARNRRSLATFHRTLKSQCIIAASCFGNRAISGVRDGHRNRKSQKSLRFRCAKDCSQLQRLNHFQIVCPSICLLQSLNEDAQAM